MKMPAAFLKEIKQPLVVENAPVPAPGRGEVLVEIMASGLCSSDLHYIDGNSPVGKIPIIPGHEIAGVISDVGREAGGAVKKNDRVAVHYLLSCGECGFCRAGRENLCPGARMLGKHADGGFARYISVPERNVIPVPDAVSFEHAALAADAIATPYHAFKLAGIRKGDTALVTGIGGLGVHAIQIPALFGAGPVIAVDISRQKLGLALELGADYAVDASDGNLADRIFDITSGRGADVIIELTGNKNSIEASLKCLAKGGRMVQVGICPENIDIDSYNDILLKEAVFTGNCDHLAGEMREIIKLMEAGRFNLSRSISRRIKLSEVNEGLRALREREGNPVRIAITEMV